MYKIFMPTMTSSFFPPNNGFLRTSSLNTMYYGRLQLHEVDRYFGYIRNFYATGLVLANGDIDCPNSLEQLVRTPGCLSSAVRSLFFLSQYAIWILYYHFYVCHFVGKHLFIWSYNGLVLGAMMFFSSISYRPNNFKQLLPEFKKYIIRWKGRARIKARFTPGVI